MRLIRAASQVRALPPGFTTGCSSAWQSVCLGCTKSRVRILPSRFSLMPRSSAEPECRTTNAEVAGSNPTGAVERKTEGSVAQLVEAVVSETTQCWFESSRSHWKEDCPVAQLAERRALIAKVAGSNPAGAIMVNVAQPVRALGCDPRGYGFDPRRSPLQTERN